MISTETEENKGKALETITQASTSIGDQRLDILVHEAKKSAAEHGPATVKAPPRCVK